MENQIFEVVWSDLALKSLQEIYQYGIETFSYTAATIFIDELTSKIEGLSVNYLLQPECRYLVTKSKMYRNLIYGSYLAVYRINLNQVEVLNVFHSSRSISSIKALKKVRV